MLMKLRDKYEEFNLLKVNYLVITISFILFTFGLFFVKNIYLFIIIYLLLLYISKYFDKGIIKLICSITAIILFGFFLINFIHINFIKNEIFKTFRIILKILYLINYLCLLFYYYKLRKKNDIKNNHRTFKKLRKDKYELFKHQIEDEINHYIEEKSIDKDSDYYELINNNLEDKTRFELEKYIWVNYLRFYKNQKFRRYLYFNIYDFIFLTIHVIIFILILFVR